MPKVRSPVAIPVLVFCALFLLNLPNAARAQATKPKGKSEPKIERLLKDAKISYQNFQGPDSFIVSFKGKEKAEIDLIILDAGTSVVILTDVAAGRSIDLTADKMRRLLEFNLNFGDFIKVGISSIGSIRVQTEQDLVLMNAKFFVVLLDQVAVGADEVAKIIGPINEKPSAK